MKKFRNLTTIVLIVVFIFAFAATAMASVEHDDFLGSEIISNESGMLSDSEENFPTSDSSNSETVLSEENENSEEDASLQEPSEEPAKGLGEDTSLQQEISEPLAEESLIAPMSFVPGADVTVNTWADLKDSVEQAESDGKVIRLDASLSGTMPSSIVLNIAHGNSVIIDGSNITLTAPTGAPHFNITNTGAGTLTLRNIVLDGTGGAGSIALSGGKVQLTDVALQNTAGTAIASTNVDITLASVTVDGAVNGLTNTAGSINVSNSTMKNITGTAVTTGNANAVFDTVTFDTVKNAITGGTGTLEVRASEFKSTTTAGITGGAGAITIDSTTFDGITNGSAIRGGNGTVDVTGSTFKNIQGTVLNSGGGAVTVDGSTFQDVNGIGISNGSGLTVINTLFENVRNNLGGHGSAIYTSGNLTIEDSSFVNSASTVDGGYIQGAIVAFGGSNRTVNITRSYFKDNVASRYGGAVGFYQFGGNVNISYSYFEGNGVTGKNASSDGGAIGVFNGNSGAACVFNIDNNTFTGNTSQDDGSAIFVESRNDTVVSNITNNTFHANKSTKYFYPSDSGGTIQLSLDTVAHLKNNTFYDNTTSTSTGLNGRGAAVGEHIDGNVRPTLTMQNNLIVGNTGANNAYRNVAVTDSTDLGNNIGYDNGIALPADVTVDNVLGSAPQLKANGTQHGAVGKGDSGHTGTLMTVTILPNDGTIGLADNTGGAPVISKDARGYTRDNTSSDIGAVEIKYVKFDANGGSWAGLTPLSYDGSEYYADATASTGYFLVGNPNSSVGVLTANLPSNGTMVFNGWYDAPTGGNKITGNVTATDQTLYAQWIPLATQNTITYYGNGSDGGIVPPVETYNTNDTATIADAGTMSKTGATFAGWNDQPNGSGTAYSVGDTFAINTDLGLYAMWTSSPIVTKNTITYHGNGNDGGAVPSVQTYNNGTTATIATVGTMSKTGATFAGWNDQPNGSGTAYAVGHTFSITVDLDLYAQWKDTENPAIFYTVMFDSQGGNTVDSITGVSPGSQILAPQTPLREGYIFQGWYTESDCKNVWNFAERTVDQDITLYAKWETNGATDSEGSSTPKTDDSGMSVLLLMMIAAGATSVIAGTVLTLKKRNHSKEQ